MSNALSVGALREQWPRDVVAIIAIGVRCLLRYRVVDRLMDGSPAPGIFEIVRIRTDATADEYGSEAAATQRAMRLQREQEERQQRRRSGAAAAAGEHGAEGENANNKSGGGDHSGDSSGTTDYEENVSKAPNLIGCEVVDTFSSAALSNKNGGAVLPAFASLHHFRIPLPSALQAANSGTSAAGPGQEMPAPPPQPSTPSSHEKTKTVGFVDGQEDDDDAAIAQRLAIDVARLGGVDSIDHNIMSIVQKLLRDRSVFASDPEALLSASASFNVGASASNNNNGGGGSAAALLASMINSKLNSAAACRDHVLAIAVDGMSFAILSVAPTPLKPRKGEPIRFHFVQEDGGGAGGKAAAHAHTNSVAAGKDAKEKKDSSTNLARVQQALDEEELLRHAHDDALRLRRTGAFPFAVTACAMFCLSYTDMGGLSDAFRRSGSSAPVVGPLPFPADASMSRCMKELCRMGVMCLRQKHCALCYSVATGNFVVLDMGSLSSDDVGVAARAVVATGNLGAGWTSIVWAGPLCRSSSYARGGTSHRPKTVFRVRFFCYNSESGVSSMETVPIPCEALAGADAPQPQQQNASNSRRNSAAAGLSPSGSGANYGGSPSDNNNNASSSTYNAHRSGRLRSRRRSTISKLAPEQGETQQRKAGVIASPFSVSGQRMCILTNVANDTALLPLDKFDEVAALRASAAAAASSSRMTATSTTQWTRFVEVAGRVSFEGWLEEEQRERAHAAAAAQAEEDSASASNSNVEASDNGGGDAKAAASPGGTAVVNLAAIAAASRSTFCNDKTTLGDGGSTVGGGARSVSPRQHRRSATPEQRRRRPTAVVAQAIMQERVFTVPELEWSRFVTVHERYTDGGNYDEVLCYSAARGCAWVSRIAYDDRFHVAALAARLAADLEEDAREDAMIQEEIDQMIVEGSHSGIFLPPTSGGAAADRQQHRMSQSGAAAGGSAGAGAAAEEGGGSGARSPTNRARRTTFFEDGGGAAAGAAVGASDGSDAERGRSSSNSPNRRGGKPAWGTGGKASSRRGNTVDGPRPPPTGPRDRIVGGRNRAAHFQRVEAQNSRYDQHGRRIVDDATSPHSSGGARRPGSGSAGAEPTARDPHRKDGGGGGEDGRDTQPHRPGTSPHGGHQHGGRSSSGASSTGRFHRDEVTGKWVRPQQRSSAFAPLLFPKDRDDRGTTGGLPPRPGTSGHSRASNNNGGGSSSERPSSGRAPLPRLAHDDADSDAGVFAFSSFSRPGSASRYIYSRNDPRRAAARAAAKTLAERVAGGKERAISPLQDSQRRRNKSLAFSLSEIQKLGVGEEGADEAADLTKILQFMRKNEAAHNKIAAGRSAGGSSSAAASGDETSGAEEDDDEEKQGDDDNDDTEDPDKKKEKQAKRRKKFNVDAAIYKRAQELVESGAITDEWIASAFRHVRETGYIAEEVRRNNAVFSLQQEVLPTMAFTVPGEGGGDDEKPHERAPLNRPGWSYVLGAHDLPPKTARQLRAEREYRERHADVRSKAVFDEEKIKHFHELLPGHSRKEMAEKALAAQDKQLATEMVNYDAEKGGPRFQWTSASLAKFYDGGIKSQKLAREKAEKETEKEIEAMLADPRGKRKDVVPAAEFEDLVKKFGDEYPARRIKDREKLRKDEDRLMEKTLFVPSRFHDLPDGSGAPQDRHWLRVAPPPLTPERRAALADRLCKEELERRSEKRRRLEAELEAERLKKCDEEARRVVERHMNARITQGELKESAERLSVPVIREAAPR